MSWLMLISFLSFTALVAVISWLKTRTEDLGSTDGFFLGGRSLNWRMIGGSLMLTNLSTTTFLGMSGQAYSSNMSVMGWEVSSGIALVLVAFLFVPRYLKEGLTTIPEFLETRYNRATRYLVSIFFLLSYIINVLPPALYSGGLAMVEIFNIDQLLGVDKRAALWIMIWLIGLSGMLYAVTGGLKAVAVSDMINGIGLLIGGLMIPWFALRLLGDGSFFDGLKELTTSHPEKLNAVGTGGDDIPFGTMFTGIILVNLYYWGTDQSIIQRALGAKNLKEAQKGVLLAGFLKILTPFMVILPGVLAFHLFADQIGDDGDRAYPFLVSQVLPEYLRGFFAAVLFGAVLSTFNSVLNSASTLFSLGIWQGMMKQKSCNSVKVGRLFALFVAILSMVIAPFLAHAEGLLDYVQKVNGFFNVPILTIILAGYLFKKIPSFAAFTGLLGFSAAYAVLQLFVKTELHFLHQLAILFAICLGYMILMGKIFPAKKEFVLQDKGIVDTTPWRGRYIAAVVIFVLVIVLYLVFSSVGIANVL